MKKVTKHHKLFIDKSIDTCFLDKWYQKAKMNT